MIVFTPEARKAALLPLFIQEDHGKGRYTWDLYSGLPLILIDNFIFKLLINVREF